MKCLSCSARCPVCTPSKTRKFPGGATGPTGVPLSSQMLSTVVLRMAGGRRLRHVPLLRRLRAQGLPVRGDGGLRRRGHSVSVEWAWARAGGMQIYAASRTRTDVADFQSVRPLRRLNTYIMIRYFPPRWISPPLFSSTEELDPSLDIAFALPPPPPCSSW